MRAVPQGAVRICLRQAPPRARDAEARSGEVDGLPAVVREPRLLVGLVRGHNGEGARRVVLRVADRSARRALVVMPVVVASVVAGGDHDERILAGLTERALQLGG